jgi:hypothetical protein
VGLDGASFPRTSRFSRPPSFIERRNAHRKLRTLLTHERLASGPRHAVTTTYWAVAPNKLRYQVH